MEGLKRSAGVDIYHEILEDLGSRIFFLGSRIFGQNLQNIALAWEIPRFRAGAIFSWDFDSVGRLYCLFPKYINIIMYAVCIELECFVSQRYAKIPRCLLHVTYI